MLHNLIDPTNNLSVNVTEGKGISRQWSGNGAIGAKFPLQEVRKTKLTIMYIY